MKKIQFYESNFSVPDIPQKILYSQRMKDFNVDTNRISVLIAPAGFGKTTVVLLSLENYRENIKWYRLNREDSILRVWYSHLISVLFSGEEGTTFEVDSMGMLASVSDIEEDYPLLNAQIVQDAYAVCENSESKTFFVLDDFHYAVDNKIIIETVQYLAENLPQGFSVVITSRRDPKIISGRLALRDDVRRIQAKDLLFTKEEANQLIRNVYELDVTSKHVDTLYKRTEGWIAGLYLLCGNKKMSDSDIETIGTGKKGEELFSLFLSKYLRDIDGKRREILIKLSVLDDFSCEELAEILKVENSEDFIMWLESGNFYIQKVLTMPVRYRFHALFQDELLNLFEDSLSEEEKCAYLKLLGEYYSNRDKRLSIRFYTKGGFVYEAISIAEECSRDFFNAGAPEKMFLLIEEFPEEIIESNPYLLIYKGMFYLNSNRISMNNTFLSAMDGFKNRKDLPFLMNTFGMLLITAYQNNGFSVIEQAYKKLPVLSLVAGDAVARQRLIISIFIAFTGLDKLKSAKILFKLLDRRVINNDMWDFSYKMIRGIYFYRRGELEEAARNLDRILSHPVANTNDQWRIIGLVSCCNVPFLRMDFDLIQRFINEFFLLGEKYNSAFASGYGYFMSAYFKYGKGDVTGAIKAIDDSIEAFNEYGGELLVKESIIIRALWCDEKPDEKTVNKVEEIYETLKLEKPGHGFKELALTTLGVLYKRLRKFDGGYVMLTEAMASVKKIGAKQSVCGLMLQLADLCHRKGDKANAESYALSFAELAEEGNYVYWREGDISSIRSVYSLLPEEFQEKSLFKRIADMYGCNESTEIINEKTTVYCKMLGGFSIKCGDICLSENNFKTRKVSGILKYILTLDKGMFVSRERLASIFWPEADSKSAFASLRVALYELRKTLATAEINFENEDALLIESKEGFTVNTDIIIKRDTDDLETLYSEYNNALNTGKGNDYSYSVLKAVCDIYDGDFLQGQFYDNWATVLREHYSSIYFEALYRLAESLIAEGDFNQAETMLMKGLQFEPLDEECCKLIVEAYTKSGQKDRADHFLKKFSQRYKKEMGAELILS